jgi:putative flippase GtrA
MAKPHRLHETVRYLLAGSLGFGLYYLLLYVLTESFGWWYILSAAFASLVNCATNFLLQKFWTFKNKNRANMRSQAVRYTALFTILFFVNLGLLYVLTEYVHIWYIVAQIPVSIILTLIGYRVTKRIFKT